MHLKQQTYIITLILWILVLCAELGWNISRLVANSHIWPKLPLSVTENVDRVTHLKLLKTSHVQCFMFHKVKGSKTVETNI